MPIQSIHIPTSGLRTAQRNLAVTGHNMANVSTDGFSRQRVNQATFVYRNMGRAATNTLQIGLGTDILGIQRIRNQFLDLQFRNEIGRANFYERMHLGSTDLEASMRELHRTHSGIAVTRKMWASLQELSTNPSGIDTRSNFISASLTYINRMDDTHRRMLQQQNVLNNEVKTLVDLANELLQTIEAMNRRIGNAEAFGQAANDFRDTRDLAMDRLAALLDVSFRVDPRSGDVQVTSGGHTLISGGFVEHIGLRFTQPGTNFVEPVIGPAPGDDILSFDPSFENAHSLLNFRRPPGEMDRPGAIMGIIMARGLGLTNHADAESFMPLYMAVDAGGAGHWDWDAVNNEFVRNSDGAGSHNLVSYEPNVNTRPPYVSATHEFIQPGQIQDPDLHIVGNNGRAISERALRYWYDRQYFNNHHTVIPRTMRQLDILFNYTVTMINEFLTNQNAETNPSLWGEMGPPTFNLLNGNGINIFEILDANFIDNNRVDQTVVDYRTSYRLVQFSLGNVVLNPRLLTPEGYNLIGLSRNEADIDDPHIIMTLLDAWQSRSLSLDGSAPMNVDDFYNTIVTNLATSTARLGSLSETQNYIATDLDGVRHRVFGVSLEEEMTNMILFQHSFNAAARVVNTVDGMIETLVARTGRVGL